MTLDNNEIVAELEYLADRAEDEVTEHDLNALAKAIDDPRPPIGLEEGEQFLNEQIRVNNRFDGFIDTERNKLYANYRDYPTPPTDHIDLPERWGWEWAHENPDGSYRGVFTFPRE